MFQGFKLRKYIAQRSHADSCYLGESGWVAAVSGGLTLRPPKKALARASIVLILEEPVSRRAE